MVRVMGFVVGLWMLGLALAVATGPPAPVVTEALRRGPFETYHFVPTVPLRTIVLFGSGDGGWGHVETKICTLLERHGCYAVGIDCKKYADTDYDGVTLSADYATIAADAARRAGKKNVPVIFGGWSMGAVQALAASGGAGQRAQHLVGLLLMSMDRRGRYGLRFLDTVGFLPKGDNTFAVADFTDAVANLRVVQYSAKGDWMNDVSWITKLASPHRLFEVPDAGHDFNGVDESFQVLLLKGLDWILDSAKPAGDERHRSS